MLLYWTDVKNSVHNIWRNTWAPSAWLTSGIWLYFLTGQLSNLCWTLIFLLFSSVKHKTVTDVGIEIISVELNRFRIEMNKTVHSLQNCCSSVSADLHTLYCKSCIWLIFSLFVHNCINQKCINNGSWGTI